MTRDKLQDPPSQALVTEGPVLLTLHADGVAHVRLNRPESANGLNMELLKALHEVLMQVHGDGRVRAVLLTGDLPSPLDRRAGLTFLKSKRTLDPEAEQYRPKLMEVAPGHFVAEHDPA